MAQKEYFSCWLFHTLKTRLEQLITVQALAACSSFTDAEASVSSRLGKNPARRSATNKLGATNTIRPKAQQGQQISLRSPSAASNRVKQSKQVQP